MDSDVPEGRLEEERAERRNDVVVPPPEPRWWLWGGAVMLLTPIAFLITDSLTRTSQSAPTTLTASTRTVGSPPSAPTVDGAQASIDRDPLVIAARSGDAVAQNSLAIRIQNGDGLQQDLALAVQWYRAAADQGLAHAQYNLGLMYEFGTGIERDLTLARTWYEKAAAQHLEEAMGRIRAMDLTVAEAKAEMAERLERDGSDPRNLRRAARLYGEAAKLGHDRSRYNLERLLKNVPGVLADVPSPTPKHAESETAKAYIHASRGYVGVNLREGPGSHEPVIDTLENGTLVTVEAGGGQRGWTRVRTPTGRVGWVVAVSVRTQ